MPIILPHSLEKFASGCDLVFGSNGIFERLRERITKRGHPAWFQPRADMERDVVSADAWQAFVEPVKV